MHSHRGKSVEFDVTANNVAFDDIGLTLLSNGAATQVPEPFTIIGTIIGGTAALRMRKQLKSSKKV
jgi:hypothetical protein